MPGGSVAGSVREGLNSVLEQINPAGTQAYENLCADLLGGGHGLLANAKLIDSGGTAPGRGGIISPDSVNSIIDAVIPENDRARGRELLTPVLDRLRAKIGERLERSWSNSVPFDLVGDWKKLIQHFTRFQRDYADALFARLVSGRQPSLGHRYLAFLVKFLGIRAIFTYNFDNLIERALELEGIHAEVFAMEDGATLPHPSLVHDALAVVKLHGSNHALLLDERLDHPVTKEYRRRFRRIAGKNPLLLVVGCSGNDFRLRNLVEQFLRPRRKTTAPAVIWLHYEPTSPRFLANKSSVRTCVTNNPGATLLHLHSRLRGCNPSSPVPYLAAPPSHQTGSGSGGRAAQTQPQPAPKAVQVLPL